MQGKWSLSNWLFDLWPSLLLPASQGCTNGDSAANTKNHLQQCQLSKLVDTLSYEYIAKQRLKDFGGAWTAAMQAAIGVFSWPDVSEAHGRDRTYGNEKLHQDGSSYPSRHVGAPGSIDVPLSLANTNGLSSNFGHFLTDANLLCLPAVLALSGVVMPPLDTLASKLVPVQLEKDENDSSDKDDYVEERVGVVNPLQVAAIMSSGQGNHDTMVVEPTTAFQFPTILYPDLALNTGMQVTQPHVLTFSLHGVSCGPVRFEDLINEHHFVCTLLAELQSCPFIESLFDKRDVRPDTLKAQFGKKYDGVSLEELKHNPGFYDDLLRHDLGMTMRLMVYYKSLNMIMVRSAFDTSLRNRLKKIKGVENDEGMEIFNSYFSQNLMLPRGTIIDFRWLPGGQLRTEIDGQLLGTIHSRDFCRAFFDIYVGDPPVSLKAKEEMGEKLGQILQMS